LGRFGPHLARPFKPLFISEAIDWGWSIDDTTSKLPEVSEKARERARLRDEGYPRITAQCAALP
jgi:hypothetical protein